MEVLNGKKAIVTEGSEEITIFLTSDQTKWITGSIINVDGELTS